MSARESAWAKAPEFSDQPERRARLRAATARDRRDYLESGLRPVECRRCGTCVLAKKNSPKHTSVQWSDHAVDSCPEFAARAGPDGTSAHVDACSDLQASIDTAVREGRLDVPDPG